MSKVATIVPVHHLHLIKDDNYFMALAHVARVSKEYVKFFQERAEEGKFIILDNSAVEEGNPGKFDDYFKLAVEMNVSQIMVPDHFKDPMATLMAAKNALERFSDEIDFHNMRVMVIPQGNDLDEWSHNCAELVYMTQRYCSRLPTIGISCRYTSMFNDNRQLGVLRAMGSNAGYALLFHFLGCYTDPNVEIKPVIDLPFIQGVDSSYPSVYAEHGYVLGARDFSKPRPKRNIDFVTDRYPTLLLQGNILAWRLACQTPRKLTA